MCLFITIKRIYGKKTEFMHSPFVPWSTRSLVLQLLWTDVVLQMRNCSWLEILAHTVKHIVYLAFRTAYSYIIS